MVVMVMGCNSGGVKGEGTGGEGRGAKSLSEVLLEVGRSAENVFYSFLELVSGSLRFTVKATTKKNEVGDYFDSLGKKLEIASGELEKVAEKASADVDKEGILNKGIRAAVDTAKTTLSTLKGHLKSLKGIGDDNVVGEAASNTKGVASAELELKKAYKALKGIVDTSVEKGVEKPKAGDVAVKVSNADNKDGVKILSTNEAATVNDASKAALILASVSGEEMLSSIVNSQEGDQELVAAANANTTAISFAKGGQADHLAGADTPKAAAVAGGIALRSLIKTGKLAAGGNSGAQGGKEEVQGVGITAINKLLVVVEDVINKTVKNVLGKTKEKIDEVRSGKGIVNL
ncbi:Variable major outer membrane lipoprotein (plasmid) [Borrelia crocidurae DOU]|uniref:Variable large protein n=1 Tax=Borrelia crocidurae DOU TaxID=1293575 RepID=W5SKK6_9SPIR|nr:variable large family protein [Borrelia crocidurae]AHH07699.1 Variable major outer membrane lipoprotein [Borrelia crocidurae DOU]